MSLCLRAVTRRCSFKDCLFQFYCFTGGWEVWLVSGAVTCGFSQGPVRLLSRLGLLVWYCIAAFFLCVFVIACGFDGWVMLFIWF